MTVLAEVRPEIVTAPLADLEMLTGTWRNTNRESEGIVSVVAEDIDGELWVRFFGAVDGAPADWGSARATVFFDRNDTGMEQPFVVRWDHGFMTAIAHGFLRQGVLVILTFTRFRDGDPRPSYFSKEFFFRD
jgi:hypothetical protein